MHRDALFSSLFPPLQLFFRGLAMARREAASGAYGLPLSVLAMQLADIVLQQALPCVFVSVTYRLIDSAARPRTAWLGGVCSWRRQSPSRARRSAI